MTNPKIDFDALETYAIRGLAERFNKEDSAALFSLLTGDWKTTDPVAAFTEALEFNHRLPKTFNRNDEELKLLLAVDYALPRMTTASSTVSEAIIRSWPSLTNEAKDRIFTKVETALSENRAGDEIDRRIWQQVLDHANALESAVDHDPALTTGKL